MIQNSNNDYLDSLEAGMADKKKLLTVEIPVALHRAAKLAALKRGITLREMVIKGLQAQVKGGRT